MSESKELRESDFGSRASHCYAALSAMVEWFDSEEKLLPDYDHWQSVKLCEKAETLSREALKQFNSSALDCSLNVPVCCVSVSMVDLMIDYLTDLRGEWSYKEGERAGNDKEYQGLCDFIDSLKRIQDLAV